MIHYLDADVPLLLWGAPGTGKTSALLALAQQRRAHCEVLIGATLDPVDVGGYLVPTGGSVVSIPPPWAQRLRAALDRGQQAWLVLDELSCAAPAVQAALLRVVQERRVGEVDLRGCRVVAAANPEDSAADGGTLAAATANRWAHIDWTLSADDWTRGELSGWGAGHATRTLATARADVCAFITAHPSALLRLPEPGSAETSRAWPSPRSWSHVARVIAAGAAPGDAARALVGPGSATEFSAFIAARDLPDPEHVLAGAAPLPTRADRISATLQAVVSAVLVDHPDRQARVNRAWRLLAYVRADAALVPARVLLDVFPSVPDEARALGKRILDARKAR